MKVATTMVTMLETALATMIVDMWVAMLAAILGVTAAHEGGRVRHDDSRRVDWDNDHHVDSPRWLEQ